MSYLALYSESNMSDINGFFSAIARERFAINWILHKSQNCDWLYESRHNPLHCGCSEKRLKMGKKIPKAVIRVQLLLSTNINTPNCRCNLLHAVALQLLLLLSLLLGLPCIVQQWHTNRKALSKQSEQLARPRRRQSRRFAKQLVSMRVRIEAQTSCSNEECHSKVIDQHKT